MALRHSLKSLKTMIEVLSHPTYDCPSTCVMLQNRKGQRYLFGQSGEGLQRVLNQNRVRVSKLKSVNLTGNLDWKAVGGLPGLLLTVNDQGAKNISIKGNYNAGYAISTWRKFMFHSNPDLKVTKSDEVETDEFCAIAPVKLRLDEKEHVDYPVTFDKSQLRLSNPEKENSSQCYIIQILPSRGKFLPQRARELGVQPGRDFGKLTNGEVVRTPEGKEVTPEMVMDQPKTPPRILVVDIPTQEYLAPALATDWKRTVSKDTEVDIRVVYHMLGADVDVERDDYQDWIKSFGDNCMHYIFHPKYSPNGILFKAMATLTCKLRQHLPTHFTRLASGDADKQLITNNKIKLGYATTITAIEPEIKHNVPTIGYEGQMDWDAFEKSLGNQSTTGSLPPLVTNEPEIITLGTGSAMPSKYRNVLSSLLRVPTRNGVSAVLLDCGEGTLGTLKRVYGDKLPEILQELKLAFISHLHADHHLGTMSVLREWALQHKDSKSRLVVVAPYQFGLFIKEWAQLEDVAILDKVQFIDTETFMVGQGYHSANASTPKPTDDVREMLQQLGITQIKSCRAFHCDLAYSVAMSFDMGQDNKRVPFKVAFSGDTRPNEFFARRIGQNCDLLIHEATHDNELQEEAKKKRHSTINEALKIGHEMRANAVVLTHFSQRYPKLPSLERANNDQVVGIAFDGMQMPVSQIGHQLGVFDKLQDMFREVDEKEGTDEA